MAGGLQEHPGLEWGPRLRDMAQTPAGRECSFCSWGALRRTWALKGTGLSGAEHTGGKSRHLGTDRRTASTARTREPPSPTQTRGFSPGTEEQHSLYWQPAGVGSAKSPMPGPWGAGEPLGQPPGAWRGSRGLPLEQSKARCSGRWQPPGGAGESSLVTVALVPLVGRRTREPWAQPHLCLGLLRAGDLQRGGATGTSSNQQRAYGRGRGGVRRPHGRGSVPGARGEQGLQAPGQTIQRRALRETRRAPACGAVGGGARARPVNSAPAAGPAPRARPGWTLAAA